MHHYNRLILLLLIFITGCSSFKSIRETNITSSELQESVYKHHSKIQTMNCEGQILIETPENSQSGSFLLILKKPDSLLIVLRGPFGIKVGSVLVTRSEFLFYNSIENKLISGSTNPENLERILRVKISFEDLLNLFGGGAFYKEDIQSTAEIKLDDENYLLIYNSNNFARYYWIEPDTKLIQKIQLRDLNNKLMLEQTFVNYEKTNGVMIPYVIRIAQPNSKRMLSLSYTYVELNKKNNRFTFTIPKNAERIRW